MKYLYALILMFIVLQVVVTIYYSLRYGISPMPTSPAVKKKVMEMLPSHVNGNVYELGAGWGTLAFALARRYSKANVIAYEVSPVPYFFMRIVNGILRYRNLKIYRADFLYVNLSDANFIYCYLFPGAMHDLKVKFEHELKSGTTILTHTFAIPGWMPRQMERAYDIYRTPVYVYSSR